MLPVHPIKITNMLSGLNVLKTVSVADSLVAFGLHRFFLLKALCVVVFCETPLEVFASAAAHGAPNQTVWDILEVVQAEEKRRNLNMLGIQNPQSL